MVCAKDLFGGQTVTQSLQCRIQFLTAFFTLKDIFSLSAFTYIVSKTKEVKRCSGIPLFSVIVQIYYLVLSGHVLYVVCFQPRVEYPVFVNQEVKYFFIDW